MRWVVQETEHPRLYNKHPCKYRCSLRQPFSPRSPRRVHSPLLHLNCCLLLPLLLVLPVLVVALPSSLHQQQRMHSLVWVCWPLSLHLKPPVLLVLLLVLVMV